MAQLSELVSRVLHDVGADDVGTEVASEPRRRHIILSKREEEMLRLIAKGLTNKEIARQLVFTQSTVKTHVSSLFNRLGVDSRAQAVAVCSCRYF